MRLSLGILTVLLAGVSISASTGGPYKRQNATSPPGYAVLEPPLTTDWTYKVGTNPWPEYPRPLLERSDWKNLNGVWQYRNASNGDIKSPPFGTDLGKPVLVPFCLESGLSGKSYTHV
jgi:hypothetical protein